MLTFKNINLVFGLILSSLIAIDILYDLLHPFVIFISLLASYLLIVFYGCYFIRSNFFMKVFCSLKTDRKQIAISFDDGPSEHYTAQILDTLKQHNVKASFFCIGKHIQANEKIFKQLHEDDHIIGKP